MHSTSMIRVVALGAICLVGTAAIRGRLIGETAAPTAARTGVIDTQRAIWGTAEGKRASSEMELQFVPRQKELDVLSSQINDLRQELVAGQTLGTADAQHQRRRQAERLVAQFDRKRKELDEDVQAAHGDVARRITGKMRTVLERYCRENGYVLVLDFSSAQNSSIAYKADAIEVTQDIIRLYDQASRAR